MFRFFCWGHKNILSTHRNTLEFTKDPSLTKNGDCIVGVRANFDGLPDYIKGKERIKAKIIVDDLVEEFSFAVNPDFCDDHEIVIRKTEFNSTRTLGFHANKAAIDLRRDMIEKLKEDKQFEVIFEDEKDSVKKGD